MNKTLRVLQLWLPFAFAAFLCGMTVFPTHTKYAAEMPPGFTAFFCFLPMAFYFVAQVTHNQFSRLERRINELEARLKNKNA